MEKIIKNKQLLIIIVAIDFVVFTSLFLYLQFNNITHTGDEVHIHAGFKVFKEGEMVDFTSPKFMYFLPCGDFDTSSLSKEELDDYEQKHKVHLHNNVGDVVHIHREGALWGDLFQNLKYQFEGDLSGFINGIKVGDILTQPIRNNDSLVLLEGNNDSIKLEDFEYVKIERIEEIAHSKENCS